MAVSNGLVDFNKRLLQLTHPPIIVNDMVGSSVLEKEKLQALICTRYGTDLLKNVPSCDCGETTDEHNIGVICKNCGTEVVNRAETNLEPILWVRAPKGVDALISPIVWIMLTNRFMKASFNTIQWICDTNYRYSQKDAVIVSELVEAGIQRGYNNFIRNFDETITKLLEMKRFSNKTKFGVDSLYQLLQENKERIFSQYLPLVNRTLLVIEDTSVGTYVDPYVPTAIDAILTVASIDSDEANFSQRVRENRTVKFIAGLASYYENFMKNNLGSKQGVFRQNTYGSRSNFSFRAVVTSITDPHEYDEIHIPWGIGITVFRYHIVNKLRKRGYTVNEAINLINSHAKKFHPLLDEIFKELIDESPRKGIDVTLNRNPSLARGSIQRVRVTKVKQDPSNNTISFSILIVTPLNAKQIGVLKAL